MCEGFFLKSQYRELLKRNLGDYTHRKCVKDELTTSSQRGEKIANEGIREQRVPGQTLLPVETVSGEERQDGYE